MRHVAVFVWLSRLLGVSGVCDLVMYPGTIMEADVTKGDSRNVATLVQLECFNVDGDVVTPAPIFTYSCVQGVWDPVAGACVRCPRDQGELSPALAEGEQFSGCYDMGGVCMCNKMVKKTESYTYYDYTGTEKTETYDYMVHRSFQGNSVKVCSDVTQTSCASVSEFMYSWDLYNLDKLVTPQLQCEGDEPAALPRTMKQSYWMPPVESDAVYEMLNVLSSFGFEDPERIRSSWQLAPNKATIMFVTELGKQGSTVKVGPSISDFQTRCKLKLNTVLDKAGTDFVGGRDFFSPAGSIRVQSPPCSVDGMTQAHAEWETVVKELKGIATKEVNCTASSDRESGSMTSGSNMQGYGRRLQEQASNKSTFQLANEVFESWEQELKQTGSMQDQMPWAKSLRQGLYFNKAFEAAHQSRRLNTAAPKVPVGGERKPGELYNGMSCEDKRSTIERKIETGLSRAFMFSTKDAFIGCSSLLNKWSTYEMVDYTHETDACSESMTDDLGNYNTKWVNDPCCNWQKRVEQCCAPKQKTYKMQVIKGINETKVAEYGAIFGAEAGEVALSIAMQYATMERGAALMCFQPLNDFWNAVKDTWKLVETCSKAIQGSWNGDYQQNVGDACTTDVDCWTLECGEIKSKSGGGMYGGTGATSGGSGKKKKFCKTPMQTASRDFVGPMIKCLVDSSPPAVGEYFMFKMEKEAKAAGLTRGATETKREFVNRHLSLKRGWEDSWCEGWGSDAWSARSQGACEKEQQCNWAEPWRQMDDATCLNPCQAGGSCTQFCGIEGGFTQANKPAKCLSTIDHQLADSPHNCAWEDPALTADFDTKCQQCKTDCSTNIEACNTECDTCRTGCDSETSWSSKCQACTGVSCETKVGATCETCMLTMKKAMPDMDPTYLIYFCRGYMQASDFTGGGGDHYGGGGGYSGGGFGGGYSGGSFGGGYMDGSTGGDMPKRRLSSVFGKTASMDFRLAHMEQLIKASGVDMRRLQEAMDGAGGGEQCTQEEEVAYSKCSMGCDSCQTECKELGAEAVCQSLTCNDIAETCSDTCTETKCTVAGVNCVTCAMDKCMEMCMQGGMESASCLMCLQQDCGCSQECIDCHNACPEKHEECIDAIPMWEYEPSPRDTCIQTCEETKCRCDTWECIMACDSDHNECKWSWREQQQAIKRKQCQDAACNAASQAETLTFDQDTWSCMYPDLSFSDTNENACLGECYGADGPNPAASSACIASLDMKNANENTCYDLGQGWIDPVWDDSVWMTWDWSKGFPPPNYCRVNRYLALNGKPWVPPPPYGETCLAECEAEMDSCLSSDTCWTWLEDQGMSVYDVCWNRFQEFSTKFYECEQQTQCSGSACLLRKQHCREEVGLAADQMFKDLKCSKCHGEWSEWEMMAINCAKGLSNAACQWTDDLSASQPCAQGCSYSLCMAEMDSCLAGGGTRTSCATTVNALNQCRECELNQCDAMCANACNTFPWWEDPLVQCAGCTSSSGCYEGAECFGNSACSPWNIEPPFGASCSLSCVRQIEACANDLTAKCQDYDPETGFYHIDVCTETFNAVYQASFETCVSEKVAAGSTDTSTNYYECLKSTLSTEDYTSCATCITGVAEEVFGPRCINGQETYNDGTKTVEAGCASTCTVSTGTRRLGEKKRSKERRLSDPKKTAEFLQLSMLEKVKLRTKSALLQMNPTTEQEAATRRAVEQRLKDHEQRVEALSRRLAVQQYPQEENLECLSSNCTRQENLCVSFFNRGGAAQARIDSVVKSFVWGPAPWEDPARLCEEVANYGSICFGNISDSEAALLGYGDYVPFLTWCTGVDTSSYTCTGCSSGDEMTCDYWCQCKGGQTGIDAMKLLSMDNLCTAVKDMVVSQAANSRVYESWDTFDARLFDAAGGCKFSVNTNLLMPAECVSDWGWPEPKCTSPEGYMEMCPGCTPPPVNDTMCQVTGFKAFRHSRRFEKSKLNSQSACEAPSCFPTTWAETKEQCDAAKFCQGDCPYCEDNQYWDYQNLKTREMCQFIGQGGEPLNENDCKIACGGAFTTECKFVNNTRTGTSVCLTPKSSDDTSEHSCKEKAMTQELSGATVTKVKWAPLKCSGFSRADCRWAQDTFDIMDCGIQRMTCKNKVDCEKSGRCEYQVDEWTAEKEGGVCVTPHKPLTFDPYMGLVDDRWEQCQKLKDAMSLSHTEYREYGCVLYKDQMDYWSDTKTNMTKKKKDCEDAGAKWFPYAYTPTECEVPGYAWKKENGKFVGSGTHMCCIRWWGSGDSMMCEMFSSEDNTPEACDKCGGTWMSMFKYRIWGQWIQGKWTSAYKWMDRAVSPKNTWVSQIPDWRIQELWQSIVNVVKTRPLSNFIDCRMGPTFSSLLGIAKQEVPQPKVGEANLLPNTESSQDFGSVGIMTDATANTGDDENIINLAADGAMSNLAPATGRRLTRRLAETNLNSQMDAACFSVVQHSGKTVGQLIGDCVAFTPDTSLSASVEFCMAVTTTIPVNSEFNTYAVALKTITNNVASFSVFGSAATVKEGGAFVCTKVKAAGTYCPAKRKEDYTSASVTSAASGCEVVKSVSDRVKAQTAALVASGFTGGDDFLKSGQVASTLSPQDKVAGGGIDGSGSSGGTPTPAPAPKTAIVNTAPSAVLPVASLLLAALAILAH